MSFIKVTDKRLKLEAIIVLERRFDLLEGV